MNQRPVTVDNLNGDNMNGDGGGQTSDILSQNDEKSTSENGDKKSLNLHG